MPHNTAARFRAYWLEAVTVPLVMVFAISIASVGGFTPAHTLITVVIAG